MNDINFDEYGKYIFAYDTSNGDVINFSEDFRREVYSRLLDFFGTTEAGFIELVNDYDYEMPDGMDVASPEDASEALCVEFEGYRASLGEFDGRGKGYEIAAILEGLRYQLSYSGEEGSGVCFIDKTEVDGAAGRARPGDRNVFLIANCTLTSPAGGPDGWQYHVFANRADIPDWFRQYFEYRDGDEPGAGFEAGLAELEDLIYDEGTDISALEGREWTFGTQKLEICVCGNFPGAADGLYDFLAPHFADYIDAEESGGDDWADDFDPDDELLFVYNTLKPNARRPLTETRLEKAFEMLDSCFS